MYASHNMEVGKTVEGGGGPDRVIHSGTRHGPRYPSNDPGCAEERGLVLDESGLINDLLGGPGS